MSVYLLHADGTDFVKIGYTKHNTVAERHSWLQTATAHRLIVLGFLPGASRHVEANLKKEFQDRRERGEWFRFTQVEREALADRFAVEGKIGGEEVDFPVDLRTEEGDYGMVVVANCGLGEYDNEDTLPCKKHEVEAYTEADETTVCLDCLTVAVVVVGDGFVEVPFKNLRNATPDEIRCLPFARLKAILERVPLTRLDPCMYPKGG